MTMSVHNNLRKSDITFATGKARMSGTFDIDSFEFLPRKQIIIDENENISALESGRMNLSSERLSLDTDLNIKGRKSRNEPTTLKKVVAVGRDSNSNLPES